MRGRGGPAFLETYPAVNVRRRDIVPTAPLYRGTSVIYREGATRRRRGLKAGRWIQRLWAGKASRARCLAAIMRSDCMLRHEAMGRVRFSARPIFFCARVPPVSRMRLRSAGPMCFNEKRLERSNVRFPPPRTVCRRFLAHRFGMTYPRKKPRRIALGAFAVDSPGGLSCRGRLSRQSGPLRLSELVQLAQLVARELDLPAVWAD